MSEFLLPNPESPSVPPSPAPPAAASPSAPAAEPAGDTIAGTDAAAVGVSSAADEPRRRRRRRRRGRKEGAEAPPAERPPPRHQPRRESQHGHGRRHHGREGHDHHAVTAIRALSGLAEGLLQVEGVEVFSMPRWIEIPVRVPLDAKRDGGRAASQVIEQILRRVKEVRDHDRALQSGAVYSFHAETAQSEACRPQGVREVFDGYSSTGRPVFTDFVTMAIERKDEGIDDLINGADLIITHVTMGRVLRTAQLVEFGKASPIYRILGQVDAGLYPLLNRSERAAFSFQLLRGATLEGRPRLRVHVVGAADLMDIADPSVAQILSRFQHYLDAESLRLAGKNANGEEVDEEEFARPLLQELARQLMGRARHKSRRTQHADERSQEGQRPTAKAYEDAVAATDQDILWDDRENTAVVVGPKGRVHVFTAAAKHVTSLIMQGSAIHKRVQMGTWRAAEPGERGEFRMALRRQAANVAAAAGKAADAPDAPAGPAAPATPVS